MDAFLELGRDNFPVRFVEAEGLTHQRISNHLRQYAGAAAD